jgi:hypothetical protein
MKQSWPSRKVKKMTAQCLHTVTFFAKLGQMLTKLWDTFSVIHIDTNMKYLNEKIQCCKLKMNLRSLKTMLTLLVITNSMGRKRKVIL